jgi:hypothetical protein
MTASSPLTEIEQHISEAIVYESPPATDIQGTKSRKVNGSLTEIDVTDRQETGARNKLFDLIKASQLGLVVAA